MFESEHPPEQDAGAAEGVEDVTHPGGTGGSDRFNTETDMGTGRSFEDWLVYSRLPYGPDAEVDEEWKVAS
jgi:hypothetical protein